MSAQDKWIRLEPGIRCRLHPTRKHGVKQDAYYVLRYTVDGKTQQEALGWASEGITLAKARIELARLKEAKRLGEGPRTLRERRAQEAQKQIEQNMLQEKSRNAKITISEFWHSMYWPAQSHKAEGSLIAENSLWKKWIEPQIGNIILINLEANDIEKIKMQMINSQMAFSTIKYAFAVISQMWNFAQKNNIVEGISPTQKVTLPKKDNRRQRYLTHAEANDLLDRIQEISQSLYCMCILALDCGLRFGEISALTWEDCNFEQETILIRDPKARLNRYAYMTKRVKFVLSQFSENEKGLIFPDTNGNKRERIPKKFRIIANELFNQDVTDSRLRVCFHTLRHTFASWLVEERVSLYEVKELMGHADLKMTQRYSHLSPDALKEVIKVLDKKID